MIVTVTSVAAVAGAEVEAAVAAAVGSVVETAVHGSAAEAVTAVALETLRSRIASRASVSASHDGT